MTASILLLPVESASAASFNCAKSTRVVEKLICSDPELSRLDSKLGEVYLEHLARNPHAQQIQRKWLGERDRNCNITMSPDTSAITACLREATRIRIRELQDPKNSSGEFQMSPKPFQIPESASASTEDIAWVPERQSSGCSEVSYDFPASLVPVQDDAAHTGGVEWHSFDQTVSFYFETKATYFGVTRLRQSEFLNTTKCDARLSSVLADELAADTDGKRPKLLACEARWDKIQIVKIARDDKRICGAVFSIAPDQKDESRFVAYLQLCGPIANRAQLQAASQRIFDSASVKYQGCCKKNPNYLGCRMDPDE